MKSGMAEKKEESFQIDINDYRDYYSSAIKTNPITLKFRDLDMDLDLLKKKGSQQVRNAQKEIIQKRREIFLKYNDLLTHPKFGKRDGPLFYLTALNLGFKKNFEVLVKSVRQLQEWEPLDMLGLITEKIHSNFFQLFILEKIANLKEDLLIACIPFFLGALYYPTNVVSPLSEFLLEKAAQNPLTVKKD